MKKYLTIILALAMSITLILCVAGCTKPASTPSTIESLKYIGDRDLKVKFDSFTTISNIFDETSAIDLNMQMGNVTGLNKVTEQDEDGIKSVDYYYRNKDLIYAVYNGYGDNIWEYYTTSKSGSPISVAFWTEENGPMVRIKSLDESLSYEYELLYKNVGTDFGNGAETIEATVFANGESYTYSVDGNNYYISSAVYWDADSLHRFSADAEDGKVVYHYDEEVISANIPEVDPTDKDMILKGLGTSGLKCVKILIGNHNVYKDKDGNMSINAETTLIFENEETALQAVENMKGASVKANDFTVSLDDGGGTYSINVGTCLLGVSSDYSDGENALVSLASAEVTEYSYRTITLDSNANITGIE